MEFLRVTQGELDGYSHGGSLAMDFGGKDGGADKLYCPCDMVVKRCRRNANGELYLESTLPVEFADGTTDYARLLCMHDSKFNVAEGSILKQGDYFYDEGGMGSGNPNKFGTHCHIEAGKGKWKSCTQSPNSRGTYVIENQAHLYDLFILGDDVQILDGAGYPWKRVSDLEKQPAITDKTVYGVDVSQNRTAGIMTKIKVNGKADFAILRATIGSVREDDNLRQYISDSRGMKIGFFSANYFINSADAVCEADFLIATVEKYGFSPENLKLPLFCDWEYFSDGYRKKQGVKVTPAKLREMTVAFCKRIMERGYRAGVYLNLDFWENWYGNDFFEKNPDLYIWYARPGVTELDRDCYIWQYAANNGTEYGADEPLDKNILLGEYLAAEKNPCENCDRLTSLKAENETLNSKIDTLLKENETLKEVIKSFEEQREEIKNQLSKSTKYVEELKAKLKIIHEESNI